MCSILRTTIKKGRIQQKHNKVKSRQKTVNKIKHFSENKYDIHTKEPAKRPTKEADYYWFTGRCKSHVVYIITHHLGIPTTANTKAGKHVLLVHNLG